MVRPEGESMTRSKRKRKTWEENRDTMMMNMRREVVEEEVEKQSKGK